jgi:hypothetical protein
LGCDVSKEQLWSWIDRDAAELAEHLATCPHCRALAETIRREIGLVALDAEAEEIPLPEKIGPYTIKRFIGEGGHAFVYEAEQPSPTGGSRSKYSMEAGSPARDTSSTSSERHRPSPPCSTLQSRRSTKPAGLRRDSTTSRWSLSAARRLTSTCERRIYRSAIDGTVLLNR